MVKLKMPKFYSIEEFLQLHPNFAERGVVAMFPTLFEHDREDKRQWLESVLLEGYNGSAKSTADYITFLTSGDALILMKSPEAAKSIVARSPLFKVGTQVDFEAWTQTLRVRLQYRGAYNRVIEMEEVEY